jgi:hypothetical protein
MPIKYMNNLLGGLGESRNAGELEENYKLMVRHLNRFVINPEIGEMVLRKVEEEKVLPAMPIIEGEGQGAELDRKEVVRSIINVAEKSVRMRQRKCIAIADAVSGMPNKDYLK